MKNVIGNLTLWIKPPSKPFVFWMVLCSLLFLFFLFFRWDWLRPQFIEYVAKKSHRQITLGRLDIEGLIYLKPTVTLQDLYIANAPWSSLAPLIKSRKISFTVNAIQFFLHPDNREVRIQMTDSQVDLESLENGLRNWRLLNPDYKGPGIYVLLSLDAQRSEIHLKNHLINLELLVAAKPSDSYQSKPNQLDFNGQFKDTPFQGKLFTGQLLSFQKTGQVFPVEGNISSGNNKLSISGKLGDIYKNQMINADVHLIGEQGFYRKLFGMNPFADKSKFSLATHIYKKELIYDFSEFSLLLGQSDLEGNVKYVDNRDHPKLDGILTSKIINVTDLVPLTKLTSKIESSTGNIKMLPSHLNRNDFLGTGQVEFTLMAKNIVVDQIPLLTHSNFKLTLKDANLKVDILNSSFYGGELRGSTTIDATGQLMKFHSNGEIKKVPLGRLIASSKLSNQIFAPINAKFDLGSNSYLVSQITKELFGNIIVSLDRGSISKKLDAKFGLDFGRVLWLSVRGDEKINLNCGHATFSLFHGIGKTQNILLDSDNTTLSGFGSFDTIRRSIDFTVTPHAKNPSIISKKASFRIKGSVMKPLVTLMEYDSSIMRQSNDKQPCEN